MNTGTNSPTQLAEDFKQHFTGKLSEDAVKRAVESLEKITEAELKAATSYSANGALASLIFYVKAQCNINGENLLVAMRGVSASPEVVFCLAMFT